MTKLEEFELARERGEKRLVIRGEARIPDDAIGTVVICHGFKGFAHFSFFPHLATELGNARFRAITFDFSGSGVGEDRENFTNPDAFTHNTYLQELEDLEAVVTDARSRGWIGEGYGVFGHSRGGGTAILHTAGNAQVRGLVTWAAISSTNRWAPEVVDEWRRQGYIDIPNARTGDVIPLSVDILDEVEQHGETRLSIEKAARSIRVPWLIVHGAHDETVPSSEAEQLAHFAGPNATLRILEGVNHSFGGKHPLPEITPTLETVTRETVEFFRLSLAARPM